MDREVSPMPRPKVDQLGPESQRWFDGDPLDLVDADLSGDVVVITLPELEARAIVRAAQSFRLALGSGARTPVLDRGLTKLAVAVGEDRLPLGEGRR
jgi:hypothetical protein